MFSARPKASLASRRSTCCADRFDPPGRTRSTTTFRSVWRCCGETRGKFVRHELAHAEIVPFPKRDGQCGLDEGPVQLVLGGSLATIA